MSNIRISPCANGWIVARTGPDGWTADVLHEAAVARTPEELGAVVVAMAANRPMTALFDDPAALRDIARRIDGISDRLRVT